MNSCGLKDLRKRQGNAILYQGGPDYEDHGNTVDAQVLLLSVMRITIVFKGCFKVFHVFKDQTFGALKQMIKDHFCVELADSEQVHCLLELSFAGATMHDSWGLADVGITPGSTIHCLLKEESQPVLYVFCAVTKETLSVMGNVFLLNTSVSRLKSLLSTQSGLPVSVFRLTTQSGLELYDCHQLNDYGLGLGTTLRLETWDGWTEFLRGCFLGHKQTVQHYLSGEGPVLRFQLRVALYVAAHCGHLDLAGWLLRRRVHPDKPVGVHPYREWCRETDHPEVNNSPIHAAAEAGQLLMLKFMVSSSTLCLDCEDHRKRKPLQICLQHRHKECVCYLLTKLWSVIYFPGVALSMWLYIRLMRWVRKAQWKVIFVQRRPFHTRVGNTVVVDGFTPTVMTSKSRKQVLKQRKGFHGCSLPNLDKRKGQKGQVITTSTSYSNYRQGEEPKTNSDVNTWRNKLPLPPISNNRSPASRLICGSTTSSLSLKYGTQSVSQHTRRTPRENAIYCLATASSFTDLPWLRQLQMARTLARKNVLETINQHCC